MEVYLGGILRLPSRQVVVSSLTSIARGHSYLCELLLFLVDGGMLSMALTFTLSS